MAKMLKKEERKALNAASICVVWIQSYCVLCVTTVSWRDICVMMVQALQGTKTSPSKDLHGTKFMNNKLMVNNYKWGQYSAKFWSPYWRSKIKKWLTATDMLLIDSRGNVFWHVFCLPLNSNHSPVCAQLFSWRQIPRPNAVSVGERGLWGFCVGPGQ